MRERFPEAAKPLKTSTSTGFTPTNRSPIPSCSSPNTKPSFNKTKPRPPHDCDPRLRHL